jgi:hypothetical protein
MAKLKNILASFWVQVGAVCLVAVLAVAARQLLLPLHGPRPQISPFFSLVDFHFGWYTFMPPLAFAAFLLPLRWALGRPPTTKLPYLALAFFALTATVNMAGGGPIKILPGALWQYSFDAQKLYGLGNFLRDFHAHVVGMHWHTTVHPPGIFLYLYPLLKLFGAAWLPVALVDALVAGAGVVFVYRAAELIYGGDAADAAAPLYVTAPSLILYGSTIDAVLCALGAAVLYLLAVYFDRGRPATAVLTGLALAAGTFVAYQFGFIWALVAVWSVLALLYRRRTGPGEKPWGVGRLAVLAGAAAVAFALFFLALYAATGFNVITEFHYSQLVSERYFGAGGNVVYWIKRHLLGAAAYPTKHRSYLLWMPGNFVAFLTLLGPPTTVLFLRNLWGELKRGPAGRLALVSIAAAAAFVLVNLTGLTLAETERVWLFMVPWFVLGAGRYLAAKGRRLLYPALLFNLALSFAWVIFFYHVK